MAACGCRLPLQRPFGCSLHMLLLHAEDCKLVSSLCRFVAHRPPCHRPPSPYLPLQRFAAFFLHKWQSAALPKPVDRDVHRVHAWIQAVYQDRRFHGEPPGGYARGAAAAAGSSSSAASEVRWLAGWLRGCPAGGRDAVTVHGRPHMLLRAVGLDGQSKSALELLLLLPMLPAGPGGGGAAAVRGAGQRHSQAQCAG